MYSPDWNPYCPEGGQFYACGNGSTFVGCCDYVDPCQIESGCSAGNLRTTSFEPSKHGTFADQECSAGLFYTCNGTTPDSFFGCCETNPCANNGCPRESLAAAYLSKNPVNAADMDPYPPVAGMSTSSAAASATSAISTASSAASTSSPSSAVSDTKPTPIGAIAGGSAGGFVLLCAIIAIIWIVRRHARKSSDKHNRDSRTNTESVQGYGGAYDDNVHGKAAMAQVAPLGTHYQDSPSTVPPYSNRQSPAPHYTSDGWGGSPFLQHGYHPDQQFHETEAHSQFKPYSPDGRGGSKNFSYGPHHSRFSPSLSQAGDPLQSPSWGGSTTVVPPRRPVANQGFARVHQGPPQEMSGNEHIADVYHNVGLGVHHVRGGSNVEPGRRPPVELDGRLQSPM